MCSEHKNTEIHQYPLVSQLNKLAAEFHYTFRDPNMECLFVLEMEKDYFATA